MGGHLQVCEVAGFEERLVRNRVLIRSYGKLLNGISVLALGSRRHRDAVLQSLVVAFVDFQHSSIRKAKLTSEKQRLKWWGHGKRRAGLAHGGAQEA